MDATLYTGTGAVQPITNNDLGSAGFKPDLVWLKSTSRVGSSHYWFDSVRGINNFISSDSTAAESTVANTLTSFDTTGFTLGSIGGDINANGSTFVGWQWQAGQGTTSSNTNGSITSTVSVNATAGFSIIQFVGNATAGATVGHGLGVAPQFYIVKSKTSSTNWSVYAKAANSGNGQNGGFYLNSTNAWTSDNGFWNSTSATSTVLSLGSGGDVNANGQTHIIYAWTPIAGFSQFGSYTGNGSTDGVFVYTGFRPKLVITKLTSSAGNDWAMKDTSRDSYNVASNTLLANLTAEQIANNGLIDINSNGFKIRTVNDNYNKSGATYIYMAFAENPFKYANAR
jgi:hypothetical protein